MPGKKKSATRDKAPAGVPFEKALGDLEAIVRRLESEDLGIEEAMAEYEKGLASLGACRAILDEAERKLEVLVREDGGKAVTKPFSPEGPDPASPVPAGGAAAGDAGGGEDSGDEGAEDEEDGAEDAEGRPGGGSRRDGFLF